MSSLSKRILIVDDDKNMRYFCSDVLTAAGYMVEVAHDGLDGLERLRENAFDLVITDINMPRLDGMGLYRKAVDERPAMKESFLFMTAGGFSMDTRESIIASDRKCLHKPFKITELLAHVDFAMSSACVSAVKDGFREKRSAQRLSLSADCELFLKDERDHAGIKATAVDISRHGLRVSFDGAAPRPGTDLGVYLKVNGNDVLRGATVVWSMAESGGLNHAGLCFPTPLPVLSIIGLAGRSTAHIPVAGPEHRLAS